MTIDCQVLKYVVALLVIAGSPYVNGKSSITSALVKHLITETDPLVRPSADQVDTPDVIQLGLELIRLKQTPDPDFLGAYVWLSFLWSDDRLTWIPAEHGNVKEVTLPVSLIWKPDFVLFNNADPTSLISSEQTFARVTHQGNVTWVARGKFLFPYESIKSADGEETLRATWEIGSWAHHGGEIDVVKASAEANVETHQLSSSQFAVRNSTLRRENKVYSCCVESYPSLVAHVLITRLGK